jgi:hypothetical protein
MSADYRKQYKPDQLEPFFPHEIINWIVVVMVCMAVIMVLAIMPVLLEMVGLHGIVHSEEPANPHGSTPVGIKPEWYFLAVYQYLRIWPTEFLGISGKTWGVLSQGPLIVLIILLPFFYRRSAHRRPGFLYTVAVSLVVALAIVFTFWGGWPEAHGENGEQLISLGEYFHHDPLFFIFTGAALLVFWLLMAHERRVIRRVMGDDKTRDAGSPPGAGGLAVWGLVALTLAGTGRSAAAATPGADPYADNNCVQCHANLPGRSAEIVALEWQHSVHYGANVGCDGCHGGNAAARRDQFDSEDAFKSAAHLERHPDFLVITGSDRDFVSAARGRSVSYLCGKCHSQIKEKHLGSPHGDFGDPTCLYCHGQGGHLITKPSTDIIDTRTRGEGGRCATCHQASTIETVRRIKESLLEAEQQIIRSTELNEQLTQWGYRDLSLEHLHQHAAEVNSRLRQVFHSFNLREINSFTGEIRDGVERIEDTHSMISLLRQVQRQQAVLGSLAVVWLVGFCSLLIYYKRTYLGHAPAANRQVDDRH